jgi:hypothetical protein
MLNHRKKKAMLILILQINQLMYELPLKGNRAGCLWRHAVWEPYPCTNDNNRRGDSGHSG